MIAYIIIDDEPLAHELIEEYSGMLPHMDLKANCYNAMEAMQFLNQSKERIDLMFLDINMPKLSGFEFLKTLKNPPGVIVTTAYKEYALEGYELNISDYLLKPFSFERFVKAVNKSIGNRDEKPSLDTSSSEEHFRFFIKGDKKYHQINTIDILYIEAYGNYSKIILRDEVIISHENISSFPSILPAQQFLRVHKSFIVALPKIKQIEGNLILIADHKIPIGRTYRSVISALYLK